MVFEQIVLEDLNPSDNRVVKGLLRFQAVIEGLEGARLLVERLAFVGEDVGHDVVPLGELRVVRGGGGRRLARLVRTLIFDFDLCFQAGQSLRELLEGVCHVGGHRVQDLRHNRVHPFYAQVLDLPLQIVSRIEKGLGLKFEDQVPRVAILLHKVVH